MRSARALMGLALSLVTPGGVTAVRAGTPVTGAARPIVSAAVRHDSSPPLKLMPPAPLRPELAEVHEPGPLPNRGRARALDSAEAAAAAPEGPLGPLGSAPPPILWFEGVGNRNSRVPPDTVADVGPNHVVQWVNLSFEVWDKKGSVLYGPANGSTIWSGFGGICETHDNGDPIVQYDPLADRWLMSQLAFTRPNDFHQCIAISQTPDPTGAWYRYDFLFSTTLLNDYPKFGVWPDAYYLAVNQFDGADFHVFRGQGALAYEREAMLVGGPARVVYFDLFAVNPNFGGALPSDLDGPIPPPVGSPNCFVEMDDDSSGWTPIDRLSLWKFHVDWSNTANSTFGVGGNPDFVIDLTAAGYPFDSDLCGYAGSCIPQPGGARVAALSDRLMYRVAYRNFGDHESLVLSHTVDVDGTDHAGIRWYELRSPGGPAPFVYQAGTHAPDADHRFMGSVAMDGAGDIALGYSVSSTTTSPSIRFAGRLASDPLGTLALAEGTLASGSGYQTGASRWGDYSSMSVDPVDDCTFWYTQEYYATIGSIPWQTRIGAFKIEGCGMCPLVGRPSITIDRDARGIRISWGAAANAEIYDVVEGSLGALRSTGGDFGAAVRSCLADDLAVPSVPVDETDPAVGDGFWYLVRGARGLCRGTYDETGGMLAVSRDAGIDGSPSACP